jgi:hypothetical protein
MQNFKSNLLWKIQNTIRTPNFNFVAGRVFNTSIGSIVDDIDNDDIDDDDIDNE